MTAPSAKVRKVMLARDGHRCVAPGCDRTDMQGHGYCRLHYHRLRRNGTLNARPMRSQRGPCIAEGCDQLDRGLNGLCSKHEARARRHGDTAVVLTAGALTGPENPRWAGEDATYGAMHQRVRSLKGKASDQRCVDCGGAAVHWSYNNSRIGERVSPIGRRYSIDPEQYEPRCVRCHSTFDAKARESA